MSACPRPKSVSELHSVLQNECGAATRSAACYNYRDPVPTSLVPAYSKGLGELVQIESELRPLYNEKERAGHWNSVRNVDVSEYGLGPQIYDWVPFYAKDFTRSDLVHSRQMYFDPGQGCDPQAAKSSCDGGAVYKRCI